jgi:hypothetical protein
MAVFLAVFGIGMWFTGSFGPRTADGAAAEGDSADADADQPLKLGLWRIRRTVEIVDIPGASPDMASKLRQLVALSNRGRAASEVCYLDREMIKVFRPSFGIDFVCRVEGPTIYESRFDGTVVCWKPGGWPEPAGTASGRHNGTTWNATIDMTADMVGIGPAKVQIEVTGEHVADDCGPAKTTEAQGGVLTTIER